MDRFEEILKTLSPLIGAPLHPDSRGACKLNIRNLLHVQLEFNPKEETILLATFLKEIPPGKFRENILKDALRANWPYPKNGTLCYCSENNQLTLFTYVSIIQLTAPHLFEILNAFIAKAESWKIVADTGNTATLIPPVKIV